MANLSSVLLEAMSKQGMSARALGRKVGVSGSTVARWLNGESVPLPIYVMAAGDVLGLDKLELLSLRLQAEEEAGRKATRADSGEMDALKEQLRKLEKRVAALERASRKATKKAGV